MIHLFFSSTFPGSNFGIIKEINRLHLNDLVDVDSVPQQ